MASYPVSQLIKTFSKYAALRSEMADRIMYSTIPYFDKDRARLTDVPAMERAVFGAKRLILLGTTVCVDEVKYCDSLTIKLPLVQDIPQIVDKNSIQTFILILDNTEKLFRNSELWEDKFAFGGEPWEKITKSIKDLAISYEKYLNETDYNKKIDLGKMVIVYMNALDGLAHNTGSLYSKLVDEESFRDKKDYRESGNECDNIYRLMNAKELKNPQDVLEEIKDELELPIVYKDYLTKARKEKLENPTIVMSPEKRKKQLITISYKKYIKSAIENFITKLSLNNIIVKELESEKYIIPIFVLETRYLFVEGKIKDSISEVIKFLDFELDDPRIKNISGVSNEVVKSLQRLKDIKHSDILTKHYDSNNEKQINDLYLCVENAKKELRIISDSL